MSDKREKILRAVLELFMEGGTAGLKVSAIAKRADVGKGTVYEYFRSKDDMFIGAVEFGLGLMTDMVRDKVELESTFRESFDSMVDCILEIVSRGPFLSMVSNPGSMPFTVDTVKRLKSVMENARESFLDLLGLILAKGVSEGVIKEPESENHVHALLIILTNMTMQKVRSGYTDSDGLKKFYYETCVKILN